MAEAGDAVDREGDLNRLRTEIVVAIIPEKDPIPAYKVNKFYREEWRGKDIPYRTYGFHDLDSFLCSLTGAVNMFMIGGEKCYKAATMDSTKHVQQLVQRQKTKTKVKRRPIMRGAYRGSYSSRGMSFAGPARTAPPHLVSAHHVSSQHFNPASSLSEGKQRIMTLLRRAGGVAFYADIQRMYLDEYRRNLDQLELRRLFGATGSAFRTLESQFRNEIHVTEPSQGRLHLRLRNFTAPVFGGGSPMRGGGTMLRGGRGGSFGGHQAISRAQPPAAFSKYLPTRPTAFGDDLPSMWDGQSAGAAPSQFTRAFNSSYNAPSLTVVVGGNGANRQVSSSSNSDNPIRPLPHSETVAPSTQSFVAPRLPSIHTNSTTQPSPTSTDRQNWPTSASSSSMSAMAQISNRTPTILKLLEHLVAMLAKRHPRGISLAELGDAYEQDYGMRLDTLAIYRKSWNELITGQFRDRLILDNDNIVHLSSKESLRQGLPAASSSAAAAQPGQPQRSLATSRSPSGPTSTTAAPPTRPAPTSSAPSPSSANANAINNNSGSAGSADMSENIRRLFEAASKETEGLPIVRVAAMLGCAEADALRTAVIQFPTYFQIKFVEGTCYVTAKRDTVLPPATAPSNLSVPSASLPSSRPSVDPIPIDFILPTQSVGFDPAQPLSSDEEADARMIWVQVSDYQSPMRFSLVLRDNVPAVTELQRQLAEFYSKLSFDECRLPVEELVLGRVCAVEYQGNGDFHRARIVDVDDNRTVARVVYVDYGSQQNVPAQFICQLDRRFADLPAQALLASFLPIRPPNGQEDFSEELGVRMGEMCNDDGQDIWAIIMEYNAAEEKMIVELCSKRMDENGEEQDMWVMEALRSEGLLEVVDREQPPSPPAATEDVDVEDNNVEEEDEDVKRLREELDGIDFNEEEEEEEEEDEDFEDELASSSSVMRDYRRQLKANPSFVQTLRNMTRIYSSIRHQKLEAMGTSTGPQQLLLTDEIANIERDLREMNDMISQHENEQPRNASPPDDPTPGTS